MSKLSYENFKPIKKVEFSILTNNDLEAISVTKPNGITKAEAYKNFEPEPEGLADSRLGTSDYYIPCTTCGLNVNKCPGHFGHVELAEPVFHIGYLNHLMVSK